MTTTFLDFFKESMGLAGGELRWFWIQKGDSVWEDYFSVVKDLPAIYHILEAVLESYVGCYRDRLCLISSSCSH